MPVLPLASLRDEPLPKRKPSFFKKNSSIFALSILFLFGLILIIAIVSIRRSQVNQTENQKTQEQVVATPPTPIKIDPNTGKPTNTKLPTTGFEK